MTRIYGDGMDLVSTDPTRSTLGVRGHEAGLGTVKISHDPSALGATDPNASALSLRVEGDESGVVPAAQGIYFDAPNGLAGKIVNFRIDGKEVFTIKPDPASLPGDPRVIVTVHGTVVTT